MNDNRITNALTVDVEDYFQVSAFEPHVARSAWASMPCRVERNVDRLLELFDSRDTHATFFTLSWIAQRYPTLVRRIVAAGHELASHGHAHLRAHEQTPEAFLNDINKARHMLEEIGGVAVLGYRAPSFSINQANPWAFDCIERAGYRYSSSVYPVRHDHYGMLNAPRFASRSRSRLVEIPITTARVLGRNFPAGGGGYFRLLPYSISRWAIRRCNTVERHPAIFYLHPWEIDPQQPRVPGIGLKTRIRHYLNLDRMEARLDCLLGDFRWDRVDRVFDFDRVGATREIAPEFGAVTA